MFLFGRFSLVSTNSTSTIGFEDHEYLNRAVKYTFQNYFLKRYMYNWVHLAETLTIFNRVILLTDYSL